MLATVMLKPMGLQEHDRPDRIRGLGDLDDRIGDHDRLVAAGAVRGAVVGVTAEHRHPLVGAGHERRAESQRRRVGAVGADVVDRFAVDRTRAVRGAGHAGGEQVERDRPGAEQIARAGQGRAVLQVGSGPARGRVGRGRDGRAGRDHDRLRRRRRCARRCCWRHRCSTATHW